MDKYLVFGDLKQANIANLEIGRRSGLVHSTRYRYSTITNQETGQVAIVVPETEAHYLNEAETATLVDYEAMDDSWFPSREDI